MSNNSSPNFPATLFPGELSLDESLATMADFVEGLCPGQEGVDLTQFEEMCRSCLTANDPATDIGSPTNNVQRDGIRLLDVWIPPGSSESDVNGAGRRSMADDTTGAYQFGCGNLWDFPFEVPSAPQQQSVGPVPQFFMTGASPPHPPLGNITYQSDTLMRGMPNMAASSSMISVGSPLTISSSSFEKNDKNSRAPQGDKTFPTSAKYRIAAAIISPSPSYVSYHPQGRCLVFENTWYPGLSREEILDCMVRRADSHPELMNLKRSHGAPEPFAKWVGCPYDNCKFSNREASQVNRHRQSTHGELVWLCPNCQTGLKRKDVWIAHLDVRPEKCRKAGDHELPPQKRRRQS